MRSDYIDTAVRVAEVSDAEKRCIGILIARYKITISRLHAGDVVVYLGTAPSFHSATTAWSQILHTDFQSRRLIDSVFPQRVPRVRQWATLVRTFAVTI